LNKSVCICGHLESLHLKAGKKQGKRLEVNQCKVCDCKKFSENAKNGK